MARPVAQAIGHGKSNGFPLTGLLDRLQPRSTAEEARAIFPRILDEYVMREFFTRFCLVLAGFVLLHAGVHVFRSDGDILRNHIALAIVGAYLVNLTPSMLYLIAPLAVLIAALVTFGVLNRNSEIIAMKATGISLYRLVVPIVSIAAILAVSLFLFDQYYLPQANRRQEALRNMIKGRPPQTYLHPEQKWIFGQPHAGEPARIFITSSSILTPKSSPTSRSSSSIHLLSRSPGAFSPRALCGTTIRNAWQFENGWVRDIEGGQRDAVPRVSEHFFPEIHEAPDYFKKEDLQSQEMNFGQLDHYIRDLRQSGFDTMRLRVALWQKLSYPLVAWSWRCSPFPSLSRWAGAARSPASPWPLASRWHTV